MRRAIFVDKGKNRQGNPSREDQKRAEFFHRRRGGFRRARNRQKQAENRVVQPAVYAAKGESGREIFRVWKGKIFGQKGGTYQP